MIVLQSIKSSPEGFRNLLNCLLQERDLPNKTINFDESSKLDDNMCAVLGALVKGMGYSISFANCNELLKASLSSNGFLYILSTSLPPTISSEAIPYIEIERSDYNKQSKKTLDYIQHYILLAKHVPKISEQVKEKLQDAIHEFFANAFGHTDCSRVHACGKWDTSNNKFHITIVNLGNTIKKNVNVFLSKCLSADDAIKWALEKGNSTKTNDTGGLGFSIIQEFVEKNEGEFYLISGEGMLYMDGKEKFFSKIDSLFPGTIVNLVINLNDEKKYIFHSEDLSKVNFEW